MNLSLDVKNFSFNLNQILKTSKGILKEKKGWLIKVKTSSGDCGWGEVAPIDPCESVQCKQILDSLGSFPLRENLEKAIKSGPGALGFGIGCALAEIDELNISGKRKWHLAAPQSAFLIPNDSSCLAKLDSIIAKSKENKQRIFVKWKVAIQSENIEKKLMAKILDRLPKNSKLRLDANNGWNRSQAIYWANYFANDSRLEWIEQPLPIDDLEGLFTLSKLIPIALDESLLKYPLLKNQWRSWQVRHPALDGDPRGLIKELENNVTRISISTAFETGIGRRCINHLAALQQQTLTPTAPGLGPGWRPKGNLFSNNPFSVWEAL
tara:strand:- start:28709 stop:29677 length:969 start_codon:yes stop_codon:yes gene_type:complete